MSTSLAKKQTTDVAPAKSEEQAMLAIVERIMADPTVSIDRVNQAFDFYRRVQSDANAKESARDFVRAQHKMEPVKKDASNPQTRSKYISYDALERALRPIYSECGFAMSFNTEPSALPDHVKIVAVLLHISGHERRYELDMPADGKGAKGGDVMTKTHAQGSAITYGRRYLTSMIWNVAPTDKDDDGNKASATAVIMPITAEQLIELNDLIAKTRTEAGAVCEKYGVEALPDLNEAQFKDARALLLKKQQMAGRK